VAGLFAKLQRAARASTLAVRAQDLAADGKYAQSLAALRRLHEITGASLPSPDTLIELNLLISQVAIALEDGPLALDAALIAVGQLEGGRERYREVDRRYLLVFARAIANYCLRWRDGDAAQEMPNPMLDIAMGGVSPRLRHRFVLPPEGSYLDPLPPGADEPLH